MEIRIDPHTLARAEERGATTGEIREVIRSGAAEPAAEGRLAKAKVFRFEAERSGRFYPEKRIRVIYIETPGVVTTVTVYVYYGKWE